MAKIASKVVTEKGVHFNFIDGESVDCFIDALPDDIIRKLAIHGLSQKGGDSYAGAESVTDARLGVEAIYRNLLAGIWAAKTTRGGKIVEALHRVTGQPLELCLEKYSAMDDTKKKELRSHISIKKALAEIEAERAAKLAAASEDDGADLNDLF